MALPSGRSYGVFAGNVPFRMGDFYLPSTVDNQTAKAGGGQQSALLITHEVTRVTTVDTAGDSIQLPPSTLGLTLFVVNAGANPMQVYGNYVQADTINNQATGTGVSQLPNSVVIYNCSSLGKWYTQGLSSGFSSQSSLPITTYSTIAANVGGTQGTGTAVTTQLTNVTAAGASYSITLPVSVPGMMITVNNISSQTVLVFPNAGGTTTEKIDALSANSSLSMTTATSTTFTCAVAGQWWTCPRVPS